MLRDRCAQATVVACAIGLGRMVSRSSETRTFDTLHGASGSAGRLAGRRLAVTHVAMRVHRGVLEVRCTTCSTAPVCHPGGVQCGCTSRPLAGRKTDVQDAERIADLLRHGLLKGASSPQLSSVRCAFSTRYRTKLGDRARQRDQPGAEGVGPDANVKLASVATDVMGVKAARCWIRSYSRPGRSSGVGRACQGALAGQAGPAAAGAQWAVQAHHRFMLAQHLSHSRLLGRGHRPARSRDCGARALLRQRLRPGTRCRGSISALLRSFVAELIWRLSRTPSTWLLWARHVSGNNEVRQALQRL